MLREALPNEVFVELCLQNEMTEEEVLKGREEFPTNQRDMDDGDQRYDRVVG